ncbi:hypothetical protein [Streptomyces sp. NPDC020489]|uniref:hypothetical protein n=1 Tax=Streptomyces sp. NPDC020489 TaxID=3365077 RepID=UPI00378BB4B8
MTGMISQVRLSRRGGMYAYERTDAAYAGVRRGGRTYMYVRRGGTTYAYGRRGGATAYGRLSSGGEPGSLRPKRHSGDAV